MVLHVLTFYNPIEFAQVLPLVDYGRDPDQTCVESQMCRSHQQYF